jgi:hypothetical protein
MEWNLDCKRLDKADRQKEKKMAVDKGKEDNHKTKQKLAMKGCRSISQRTRDRINITLVVIVVVCKRIAAFLELLCTSGYVV